MTPTHSHASDLSLAAPVVARNAERQINRAAVQQAAGDLLPALGVDVNSPGLRDTPRRVADAYVELLTPHPFRATTFPNEHGYDELIVARAIPVPSPRPHHPLPLP